MAGSNTGLGGNMNRAAVFAGSWYPDNSTEIIDYVDLKAKRKKALGAMCPHAGWIYSGATAGKVYSKLQPVSTYILIGPNHSGLGAPVSLFAEGSWATPLGPLEVDNALAKAIQERDGFAIFDTTAHAKEHSIEVQLPFIKLFNHHAKILPIALGDYNQATCQRLGCAIADSLRAQHKENDALIIASSDMSHYLTEQDAEAADKPALDRLLKLDPAGLLKVVTENEISMCGSGPAAVMLYAAKSLGATTAELVGYTNSGDVSGDHSQVVTYAGIIVS